VGESTTLVTRGGSRVKVYEVNDTSIIGSWYDGVSAWYGSTWMKTGRYHPEHTSALDLVSIANAPEAA
jgi:hypothetical protein